jgi:hypothetical protein
MPKNHSILFTLGESHAKGGQADVYPPEIFGGLIRQRTLAEYPIFRACPPLEGCQGLAVVYYDFALGRLESGAPSTFAQLG